jgi:anti-sigma B factor antagonist
MSFNERIPKKEDIDINNDGGIVTLGFLREVDLEMYGAPVFKETLLDTIRKNEDMSAMILDLENVGFVDSSALGVMIGAVKRLRSTGIPFVVDMAKNPNNNVRSVFEITGMHMLLNVVYDRAYYETGENS